jgi:hypothetical protein
VLRRRQPSSQAQGGCVNTRPQLHLHRRRPHRFFPLRNLGLPPYPQLPHATTPCSSVCRRARLNRRLRHNPSHPAVHRPRAARPYLADALPDDAHGVRGGAPTPRCDSARGGLAPQDNARMGGVWLGPTRRTHPPIHPAPRPKSRVVVRSLSCSRRGRPARSPSAYSSPSEAIESLPRFEKIKTAESGWAECRAVPCARGSTAPAPSP